MHNFKKALTKRTKYTFNLFSLKKMNKKNIKKFFDIKKNDLFYNTMIQ